MADNVDFDGAKCALFLGEKLVVILRDDKPDIAYPGLWDLPGGGREGDETSFQTVARETQEELGLILPQDAVLWRSRFPAAYAPGAQIEFFVAQMPAAAEADVVFGDEGQRWAMMTPEEFVSQPNVVPTYAVRLQKWRDETGGLSS